MKIFLDQYESLTNVIDKYNELMPYKIDLQKVVNNLVAEALQNKSFDWQKADKFNYHFFIMGKKGLLAADEDTKGIRLNLDLYKQLSAKVGGFPNMKNQRISKINNLIAAILVGTKYQVIRIKEEVINHSWTTDLLIAVLQKHGWLDNLKYSEDFVSIDCPNCGHRDFAFWINEEENGKFIGCKCDRASCEFGGGSDIWRLYETVIGMEKEDAIEEVFDILTNMNTAEIETVKRNAGYRVRNKQEKSDNIDFTDIMKRLKEDTESDYSNAGYEYMHRLGFLNENLIDGDVYFCSKERYHNKDDKLRDRVCYVVKNIYKNVIGVQARSIYDTEEERLNFIKDEDDYKNGKYPEVYKQMIEKKVLNTDGSWTSQNLYLLYKYACIHTAEEVEIIKNESVKRLVIVEGPKDALRVYSQSIKDTAVVASFSNKLSDIQISLIDAVFKKNKIEIVLAMDNDLPGYEGNLRVYKKLKKAGFQNIRFALQAKRNKSSFYNDFGEYNCKCGTASKIWNSIHPAQALPIYIAEMHTREIYSEKLEKEAIKVEKGEIAKKAKEKDERSNYIAETIKKRKDEEKAEQISEEINDEDENENGYEIEDEFELYPAAQENRTDEWFAKLKKFSKNEIKNAGLNINVEEEADYLFQNGFSAWFPKFHQLYGEIPYTQALISEINKMIEEGSFNLEKVDEKLDNNMENGENDDTDMSVLEIENINIKTGFKDISYSDICEECKENNESLPF